MLIIPLKVNLCFSNDKTHNYDLQHINRRYHYTFYFIMRCNVYIGPIYLVLSNQKDRPQLEPQYLQQPHTINSGTGSLLVERQLMGEAFPTHGTNRKVCKRLNYGDTVFTIFTVVSEEHKYWPFTIGTVLIAFSISLDCNLILTYV